MTIFGKILATTLPMALFFLIAAVGTAHHFSRQALTELAETWLGTRATEAVRVAADQQALLDTYGLSEIPASVAKAKLDAATLMAGISVGQLGYVFAVDAAGVIAVHPDPNRLGERVDHQAWFRSLTPSRGRVVYEDGGERILAIYDFFPPWQWTIFAADPEREVYGVADRMKPYIFYLVLVCAAAMTAALMLLTRRLTGPLRALTRGAERLGAGALHTRITEGSRDEIGRLGLVFNEMATRLAQTLISLKHREQHFRALTENATDLVTVLGADGVAVYQSPSVERILGYTGKGLIGERLADLIHPEDRPAFQQRLADLAGAMEAWDCLEMRLRHQDGSWRTLETTGKNLLDHPAVGGIVFNSRDVTLRRAAEAALRDYRETLERRVADRTADLLTANTRLREEMEERRRAETARSGSEQRLQAILRASPVGIALLVDRRLDWANETLYRMVGYAPGALAGQEVDILYPDYAECERVTRILHAKSGLWKLAEVETRWIRADGSGFDCALRASPLNQEAPTEGLIIAATDISDAKRLAAELQQAKKMETVGTLAGGVAHDLNNILSGIVSYPELLLLDLPPESPLKKPIETIKQSGERAAAIVQDMLTMARRGVSVADVVDINRIVSDQLKSPECDALLLALPQVALDVHLEPGLPSIRGSSVHLSKCFMNLISNAAESMPSGGTIVIETQTVLVDAPMSANPALAPGRYAAVSIADTGVGIPPADRQRVFEPFFTRKKMGRSGSGLGMSVVWATVKDHDGYIDIDSGVDRGTTFTLYFPATDDRPADHRKPFSLERLRGHGERILVVDDSEVQREIARRILVKLGYTVATVDSGEAAVAYVQDNPVDLIILDMIMPPGFDGLETYRRIAQRHPAQKAIIASGYSETARVRAAQRLGAGKYIRKPYAIEIIGLAVRQTLGGEPGR